MLGPYVDLSSSEGVRNGSVFSAVVHNGIPEDCSELRRRPEVAGGDPGEGAVSPSPRHSGFSQPFRAGPSAQRQLQFANRLQRQVFQTIELVTIAFSKF